MLNLPLVPQALEATVTVLFLMESSNFKTTSRHLFYSSN